jgi:hypothetical protein
MAEKSKKGVWQMLREGFKPKAARAGASQQEQDRVRRRQKAGKATYLKGYEEYK